jgi:hypothetical protein
MILQLRDTSIRGLDGKPSLKLVRLERQTEKALLLAIINISAAGERKVSYWFPKSRVLVNGQKPWGEIDLKNAKRIEVPEWLWDKRVAV